MTRMHLSTGYRDSIAPAPTAWHGTLTRRIWPEFAAPAAARPVPNAGDGSDRAEYRRSIFAAVRTWLRFGKGS